jgi:hypothetical protein
LPEINAQVGPESDIKDGGFGDVDWECIGVNEANRYPRSLHDRPIARCGRTPLVWNPFVQGARVVDHSWFVRAFVHISPSDSMMPSSLA